jgi:asparagine synthase (glutamine-hydrolysing)
MCGIAGFYNIKNWDSTFLLKMTHAIKHRGPDGQGSYLSKIHGVGLGHRRLSVLDLSPAGKQPMTYEDSGIWISYNGEVYNFIELRYELQRKGYKFRSETDTEVVLAAFLEWGVEAFTRFNGMWALAIYDENINTLYLCRDRYGIKPLYYYWDDKKLVFGSEYKVFLAVRDDLELKWDSRGIKTALVDPFQLEGSGFTLFRNVYNLMPGHILILKDRNCQVRQWWSTLDHLYTPPNTLKEQAEALRHLIKESCLLRMRSDVPIGTSLSGGLDSSSIAIMLKYVVKNEGLMERIPKDWQKTFIHCFPGTNIDETAYADLAAKTANAEIIHIQATHEDIIRNLDAILYDFESIYCGMPDSFWRIYKTQRENGVIVSLDGHGVDEMLGGYDWYINAIMQDKSWLSSEFWELVKLKKEMFGHNWQTFFILKTMVGSSSLLQNLIGWTKRSLGRGDYPLKSGRFLSQKAVSIEPYPANETPLPNHFTSLDRILYNDFHSRILPRILKNFDLMSMAHGVEVRMPFLDYRIVNFIFSLPYSSKIGNGYTKLVLREAMKGLLPDKIRLRKRKIGFNSPVLDWFQNEMGQWIEDCLNDPNYDSELIDKKKIRKFYYQKVRTGHLQWGDALRFWQYLNALKLLRMFAK